MKKYDVHVILNDKFHSVIIECSGWYIEHGAYVFIKDNGLPSTHPDYTRELLGWYPVNRTVIEPHNESKMPTGSAAWKI